MNVNPVVSEIVSGALRSMEEEVEDLLARIWRSPALRDGREFSVALFDRFGRALSGRVLGAGPAPILRTTPANDMRPGDVFLHNDPYLQPAGLGEMSEICLTRPLFDEDRLLAFLQVRGRHDDLGGTLPGGGAGGATESFHEGLLIPPVRIARGDERVDDIHALLLRNSRNPETLGDDIDAQLGALRLGSLRLRDLVRRYGADQLTACFADLLRECELAFQEELLPHLPEERWEIETAVESDGIDGPHPLHLALSREGRKLVLDLEGAGPQATGPINCPLEGDGTIVLSRLLSPLLLHLAEDSDRALGIPLNDGACRVFDVRLPGPGTLLTPRFPAPTGLRALTLGKLLSAFWEILFRASGGKTPAGFDNLRFWGLWGKEGGNSSFLFRESLGAGGGAAPGRDGAPSVPPIGSKGGMSVEVVESRYPIRVESAGLVPDSGGAGLHRGGPGMFREYRILAEGNASSAAGCGDSGPFGGNGGMPGGRYQISLTGNSGRPKKIPAVTSAEPISKGDILRVETPGGGGWGDPSERDPEAVRLDVLRGLVSREAAKKIYRTALGRAPGFRLDEEETRKLRTSEKS